MGPVKMLFESNNFTHHTELICQNPFRLHSYNRLCYDNYYLLTIGEVHSLPGLIPIASCLILFVIASCVFGNKVCNKLKKLAGVHIKLLTHSALKRSLLRVYSWVGK